MKVFIAPPMHVAMSPPSVGAMKIARSVAVSGRCDEWPPPFVGAMKIARSVAVSGRYDEWHSPFPAPSLRELLSAAKLRECTPMNVTAQKFQSL